MTSSGQPGESGQSDGVVSLASSRTAIDTLVWLIGDAFENDPSHSLLANLRDLSDEEWTALPPGGGRSIADIVEHVAWAKWMYEDYAFGSASLRGDQPPMVPAAGARSRPPDQLIAWLMDGHRRWLASIRALDDDSELERDRLTNWGERLPTRVLIRILIAHDVYHAGEINHLRALLRGADRWPYD
jgi:uncharacterized damage-inducible protein DinB